MTDANNKLTRIGIFYDGNFFSHVSNYYLYHHERRARINITGLHEFIGAFISDNNKLGTLITEQYLL